MYKLLPILLFAFLIGDENSTPHIIQSDSLDFIWWESFFDDYIIRVNDEVSKIMDENKFNITAESKVYDVMRVDTLYQSGYDEAYEFIDDKIKKMNDRFPKKKLLEWVILERDIKYWRLAVYDINFEINVDNSIELNRFIKESIMNMILTPFDEDIENKNEYIKFNSVDIHKYNNNQLSLNRDDIYDDSWAVIIGIDKYKYSDPLHYAVKDAEAVKDMLINKFDYPEENIRYLVDEQATLSEIKLALDDISTSADASDRILVFYSGHGETQKNIDGTETGYIIPVEGRQDKPYATGLAMDEILRTCQMSNAKHMLFLMDACYSGLMTENVKGLSKPQEKGYLSKVANEKARQIITAGGGDEQVIERDEWQHSAFTKNLLAGLDDWDADTDSDGYVTADELGTYLRKSVTEDSDFQQTPQKGRFRNSGGGEFVFINKVEKIIINEATINIVDTTNTINYDILAKKIAEELSNSNNEKTNEYSITEQSDKYYRLLISPYLGAGNLPYGIAGVSLGYNISKKSRLSLQYQIRGNESTYPYSQSDYNAINIGFTKFWGNNLNQYVSLGIGLSYLRYVPAAPETYFIFQQKDRGDMFIEIGTSIKRKTYLNPNISIRIGYSNIDGFIKTEDDIKYNLEGGYFMILGHFDLIKL